MGEERGREPSEPLPSAAAGIRFWLSVGASSESGRSQ